MNDSNNNTNPWTRNNENNNSSNSSATWNNTWNNGSTNNSGNNVNSWNTNSSSNTNTWNNNTSSNSSNSWTVNQSNTNHSNNTASWNNAWNNNSSNTNNWNNNQSDSYSNNSTYGNNYSSESNNQENAAEFSTIQRLSGRVQNKRQAVNAVLFYTNIINIKSIANWILFGVSLGLSLIFLICAGIYQNAIPVDEWNNPVNTAKIFLITWVALNAFWVTVIALKHTIMYFAQTKDNGSELLIVSKPVTRKILYWTRVLYFFIYITIYSFIIFFLTIIFCAAIGFNNITFLPVNVAGFIFLTPLVYIFFGMVIMSFTAFFCIISSTKTVNTIVSLTTLSSIVLFGITPLIDVLSKDNYRNKISGDLEYGVLDKHGISYESYNNAMKMFDTKITEAAMNYLKTKFAGSNFQFSYEENYQTYNRNYTINDIEGVRFSLPGRYSSDNENDIMFKSISFKNNGSDWSRYNTIEFDASYKFVMQDYNSGITIKWQNGKEKMYELANSLTEMVYYFYSNWMNGNGQELVDKVFGGENPFEKDIISKVAAIVADQYSYSSLNKFAPLAIMDYVNYFSMPTKLLGFDKVDLLEFGRYIPDKENDDSGKLVYGFDWCSRYMPKLVKNNQRVIKDNPTDPTITVTNYKIYNEELPKASPGWGVALFWITVSASALFSSYYLFKKKDFR